MSWYEQNRWNATIREHIKKNTMRGFLQHLMRWMGDIGWRVSPHDETHDIEFPVLPYREFLRYLVNMFLTNEHIPPKLYRCLFDMFVNSRELGIFSRLTEDFDTTLSENYTEEQWQEIKQRLYQILKEEIIINGCDSMKRAFLSNQLQSIMDDSDIRRSNIFESDLLTQFQGHIVNEQPDDIGTLSTYNLCNGLYIKDESLFRKHFDEKLKNRESIGDYLNIEFIFDRPSDYHYYNCKYLKYEDLRQILLQPHSMSPVDEENNRYKNYILQNMMKTDITVTEFIKLAEEFPMCDFRKCLVDDCHDYGMKKLDSYVETLQNNNYIYEYDEDNHRQETIDEVISMIGKYTSDTSIHDTSGSVETMGDTFQYAIDYRIQPITLLYNQGYPAISVPFYNKHLSFEEFKKIVLPLLDVYDSRLVNVLDSVKYSIKVCYVDLVTLLATDRTNECVRDMDKFVEFFVDEWGISIKYLQHLITSPVLTIDDIIENTRVETKYSWAKSVFNDDKSNYLVSSLSRHLFSPKNVEKYPDFPWDWYEISQLCPLDYEFIKQYKDKLFQEEKRYIPFYNTSLETIDKIMNDTENEFHNIVVCADGVSQNINITIPWFIEKVECGKVPLKKWCLLEVMSIIKPDKDLAAKCIQSWWRLEQTKRRLRILAGEVNEWWFSPDCFPATRVRRLAFESRARSSPGNDVSIFD